jgi:hypothetical protein
LHVVKAWPTLAVELKVGKFEPGYAGKMDVYLNLLNEKERAPDGAPSIGIILCAEKDKLEVELAEEQSQPHRRGRVPTEGRAACAIAREMTDSETTGRSDARGVARVALSHKYIEFVIKPPSSSATNRSDLTSRSHTRCALIEISKQRCAQRPHRRWFLLNAIAASAAE